MFFLVHISGGWEFNSSVNGQIALFANALGRIGVPLFLMLTGVLLLDNKLSIIDFIKRRYPRVIVPFLFWMTLTMLVVIFILKQISVSDPDFIFIVLEHYLYDRWYVWMILGVYLIIPILSSFIKSFRLKGVEYFIALWLITITVYGLFVIFNIEIPLDLLLFSGPVGYVVLGYYLHNKELNISSKRIVTAGLIVFILSCIFKTVFLAQDVIDPYSFRYIIFTTRSRLDLDLLNIIQVVSIFLVVKYIDDVKSGLYGRISNFANKKRVVSFITSLSMATYGIYLNQFILFAIVKYIFNFSAKNYSAIIFIPVILIIYLMITYGVMIVLNKIPVINKLIGYH